MLDDRPRLSDVFSLHAHASSRLPLGVYGSPLYARDLNVIIIVDALTFVVRLVAIIRIIRVGAQSTPLRDFARTRYARQRSPTTGLITVVASDRSRIAFRAEAIGADLGVRRESVVVS